MLAIAEIGIRQGPRRRGQPMARVQLEIGENRMRLPVREPTQYALERRMLSGCY